MLTPDLIGKQLERVLASEAFSTAGRHRRLLRYLVERTVTNEGHQLKEYVLATEVFDRPDTYDPRIDSIVRVEVRRLRTRLAHYYGGPGAADPVIISIPRGSYAPEFSVRQAPPDAAQPVRDTTSARPRRAWWLAAAVVLLPLLITTFRLAPMRTSPAGPAAGPGIAVLPFEPYSSVPDRQLLAGRLTDAVTAELARLETVSVASRTSTSRYVRDARRGGDLADALGVDFVVEASAVLEGERLRVVARLVDAGRDRKVWVGEYELTPAEVPAIARQIAAEAAAVARASYSARR
jgi:adenylate cyclase